MNIASAVYVSPSNQFPTGTVMPAGRRHQLLDWATDNNSIIIEDDYDSELRYFGKPVPSLKSLDTNDNVVYLGSFSSTLFPAIKISYMVLPESMADIFQQIKRQYTQTCSKAEQLTLALFMENGYYNTGIKKLRNLYSQKLALTMQCFEKYGNNDVLPVNTQSGINLSLKIKTKKSAEKLCNEAKSLGLLMIPLSELTDQETTSLIFYYSKLPLSSIETSIKEVLKLWQTTE
jgi:GntR family transcriptional regulator/MocR family aminotransferase